MIHIPDGYILHHYLTGNVVKCRQKRRGGVDSKHYCELAGGEKMSLQVFYEKENCFNTFVRPQGYPQCLLGEEH